MNAHTLRKWSLFKIFMYLLLAICSLLVFWCRGASAMHLTPLDFASSSPPHHHQPIVEHHPPKQLPQNYYISLIRNSTASKSNSHQQLQSNDDHENLKLQKLWQMRMQEKRTRIQAHRKEKILLQRLLDQRSGHLNSNIDNLKQDILDHTILSHQQQHPHNFNLTAKSAVATTTTTNDTNYQHRRENLYELLNEIRANISMASNRNRRESRFHHSQQAQQQQQQHNMNNHHNNNNHNNHHQQQQSQNHHPQQQHMPSTSNKNRGNRPRRRKSRYCSARDPRTLAFEAPTVFEGKIKSRTPDLQKEYSVTVEIMQVYKQQPDFKLPKQVRLQFAKGNASECDIYREEFRHRGFVRDELELGKIYFLFVKQISLGNFTILGQPIKKISRTTKDVEIGVSEKYGEFVFLLINIYCFM